MTSTTSETPKVQTWRYIWEMARFRPRLYLALGFFETMFFGVFPQLMGLIMRTFFNTLTGDAQLSISVPTLIVLLVASAIGVTIAGPALAQNKSSTIDQIGDYTSAYVNQWGATNDQSVISQGVETSGEYNSANVTQGGYSGGDSQFNSL